VEQRYSARLSCAQKGLCRMKKQAGLRRFTSRRLARSQSRPTPFDYISILCRVKYSVSPSCWVVFVRLILSRPFSVLTAYLLIYDHTHPQYCPTGRQCTASPHSLWLAVSASIISSPLVGQSLYAGLPVRPLPEAPLPKLKCCARLNTGHIKMGAQAVVKVVKVVKLVTQALPPMLAIRATKPS